MKQAKKTLQAGEGMKIAKDTWGGNKIERPTNTHAFLLWAETVKALISNLRNPVVNTLVSYLSEEPNTCLSMQEGALL